jgi:hypothetical protein
LIVSFLFIDVLDDATMKDLESLFTTGRIPVVEEEEHADNVLLDSPQRGNVI